MAATIAAFIQNAKTAGHKVIENCTIYRTNEFFGNVSRQDCKWIVIEEGYKYAQYDNAIRVTYLEKRKKNARQFVLTYRPFLLVVATKDAIEPDSWLMNDGKGSSVSKYASHDGRYCRDFIEKMTAAGVTLLADYTNWNANDKFNGRHTNCSRLACVIDKNNDYCEKRDHRCAPVGANHDGCSPWTCVTCTNLECAGCCPKRKAKELVETITARQTACDHKRVNALGGGKFQCRMCRAAV